MICASGIARAAVECAHFLRPPSGALQAGLERVFNPNRKETHWAGASWRATAKLGLFQIGTTPAALEIAGCARRRALTEVDGLSAAPALGPFLWRTIGPSLRRVNERRGFHFRRPF
ncbi:MAG: hypothetical protein QOG73_2077 [Acetobacteraceae bacterium]|jgi:hypothetical protein|nr:hypothetical protein [Acetobacteraceae bacterium]